MSSNVNADPSRAQRSNPNVLILSADSVAAALLGALIETLGFAVRFARPPEGAETAIRRVKPRICLLDCADPDSCNDELLGRATMRGISVVIFGTQEALNAVRTLASQHRIDMLLMPPEPELVQTVLGRALERAG